VGFASQPTQLADTVRSASDLIGKLPRRHENVLFEPIGVEPVRGVFVEGREPDSSAPGSSDAADG
jgi:hypothetical protein